MNGEGPLVHIIPTSLEIADRDADRDITTALIHVAGDLAGLDFAPSDQEGTALRTKCIAFVTEWLERKRPSLVMPKL